jgi:hypothetical protein
MRILLFLLAVPAWGQISCFPSCGGGGGGGGSVNSVSAGTLPPIFTTSVSSPTSNPVINFSLSVAAQNSIFGGPATGGTGAPSFQLAPTISAANMTSFPTFNQNTTGLAATATNLASYPTLCSGGQFSLGLSSGSNNCSTPSGSGNVSNSGTPTVGQVGIWVTATTIQGVTAPAFSAANLTSFPTLNQNTTGTAAGLSAAYIDWNAVSGGASILNKPTGTGTVTVVGAGSLTSTNCVTGGGSQTIQTPSANCTVDSSGNLVANSLKSTGAAAGTISLTNNATPGAVVANSWGWTVPATITTAWYGEAPNANPAANQIMLFPAPTSNVSQWAWTNFTLTGMGSTFSGPLSLSTNTVTCPTCITSAASLTSNAVVIGGGSQASSTISADTTTTHALFATAGAPAFRAIASVDIPTLNQSTTGTAANLSGTPTLPNGTTATSQAQLDNSTKLATTAYTDLAVSNALAGVNPAVSVQAATTLASDTSSLTYLNGVSGVGATLTGANNTSLTVDGFTFTAIGQRLLVKNDTQSPSGARNGVYYVTQLQAALLPLILTRALDYDQPSDINNTGAIPVANGTLNQYTSWLLTSSVATVGTDPLTYAKYSYNPANLVTQDGSGNVNVTGNLTIGTTVLNPTTGITTPASGLISNWTGTCGTPPCLLGNTGALYQPNAPTIITSGIGYEIPFGQLNGGAVGATTNRFYVWQFVSQYSITLSKWHFYLNTGGSGGARFALLDSSLGFLATSSVNTTLSGNADLTVTFSPAVTLYTGQTYYLGFTTDSGATFFQSAYLSTAFLTGLGSRVGFCANPSTGTGSGLTFPASCGAITASTTVAPLTGFLEP